MGKSMFTAFSKGFFIIGGMIVNKLSSVSTFFSFNIIFAFKISIVGSCYTEEKLYYY